MTNGSDPAQPTQVGMLLYPDHTALDYVGPQLVFASVGMQVHLVSDTTAPVVSDTGLAVLPTATLDDCPPLDIVFVPGGRFDEVILDRARLDFLAERGATAGHVTSVCTGSIVLAAAGLLDGYRAATHWGMREHLTRLGVEVSEERVCVDRNRVTGGGITAGIDFALTLVAHLFDDDTAKFSQLAMEYDPQPPFDAGSPRGAGPAVVDRFREFGSALEEKAVRSVTRLLEQRAAGSHRPDPPIGRGAERPILR